MTIFICNITGNVFTLEENEKGREIGLRFGYNSRFRSICYILTKMLFGEVTIMNRISVNKDIKGIGMSDGNWAEICSEKFDYINTYYHQEPYLDIYNTEHIKKYNNLDFIITSEVFEHINPYPGVNIAFDNLYKMLKPGGFVIFTVPYSLGTHKEHYPNLYDYSIVKKDNKFILYNTTINGKKEEFDNLYFHGGPGSTLEMRLYSKQSIINYFTQSGFVDITFHNITEDMNKYGIFFWKDNSITWSLVVTARKPL